MAHLLELLQGPLVLHVRSTDNFDAYWVSYAGFPTITLLFYLGEVGMVAHVTFLLLCYLLFLGSNPGHLSAAFVSTAAAHPPRSRNTFSDSPLKIPASVDFDQGGWRSR